MKLRNNIKRGFLIKIFLCNVIFHERVMLFKVAHAVNLELVLTD